MQTQAHMPRGTPSDSLMVQVDSSNVLAVRNELRFEAEQMQVALREASNRLPVRPCGGDVVSRDAAELFTTKIRAIIDIHQAHLEEILEAVRRLEEAARQYGHTDIAIQASFERAEPGMRDRLERIRAASAPIGR